MLAFNGLSKLVGLVKPSTDLTSLSLGNVFL